MLQYYIAPARHVEHERDTYIIILARNQIEAESKYRSCLARHAELGAVKDCMFRRIKDVSFRTAKCVIELDRFGAAELAGTVY